MPRIPLTTALLAALIAGPALGAPAPDRLAALEKRMQALEAEAAAASAALADAKAEIEALKQAQVDANPVAEAEPTPETGPETAEPPAEAPSASGANGNAFNPAISIVLDGQVASHSLDPDAYARAGFPLVGEGRPSAKGLSLGESEISFAASIDDRFSGQLTVSMGTDDGQDEVGVEEAFIDTTSLPGGLSLRAGRFFSNIGYLNTHHAHTDKFSDRPLAYQALLGNQYGDDGVQLRWVAPTDTYLELGGEIFRGDHFPASGAGRGGFGAHTLFAHLGGDIGDESEWLAGLSQLDARSAGGDDGFVGRERLLVADATWKWAPQGNFKDGGITVRGEVLRERRDGDVVDAVDPSLDTAWDGVRTGAYVEALYRINRRWETGYRYDRLWSDSDAPFGSDFDPYRHSVVLTWLNSEFSLLRLQFARDRPNPDDTDNVFTLQYQVNLGAHGAHKF